MLSLCGFSSNTEESNIKRNMTCNGHGNYQVFKVDTKLGHQVVYYGTIILKVHGLSGHAR